MESESDLAKSDLGNLSVKGWTNNLDQWPEMVEQGRIFFYFPILCEKGPASMPVWTVFLLRVFWALGASSSSRTGPPRRSVGTDPWRGPRNASERTLARGRRPRADAERLPWGACQQSALLFDVSTVKLMSKSLLITRVSIRQDVAEVQAVGQ